MEKKKSNNIFPLFTPATLVLQHENCTVFLQTKEILQLLLGNNYSLLFFFQLQHHCAACLKPLVFPIDVFILERQGRTDDPQGHGYKEINDGYCCRDMVSHSNKC